jgi:hypothetical protein
MKTKPYISGFCSSVALPPGQEPHHHLCRGAFFNPATRSEYRCNCDCHDGTEVATDPGLSKIETMLDRIQERGGGRSVKLREEIIYALRKHGGLELRSTGDEREDRKRGSRVWNAAAKAGMKVSINYKKVPGVIKVTVR